MEEGGSVCVCVWYWACVLVNDACDREEPDWLNLHSSVICFLCGRPSFLQLQNKAITPVLNKKMFLIYK